MPVADKSRVTPTTNGARNAPFLDLQDAIDKTRTLYQKAKRSAIHIVTVAGHLGYSPKASSLSLAVSALKKYGLAVDEGSNEGRRLRVSELGHQIVADTREVSPERDERLRRAALLPKTHRDLWEQFGADVLDDSALQVYLKLERGFSEEAARTAARVYRSTILFARLDQQGILGDVSADEVDMDAAAPEPASDARPTMDRQNPAPGWSAPLGDSPVRALSIPLKGSRTFDVRFPTDLSKDDFDFIIENIKLWERQIVSGGA